MVSVASVDKEKVALADIAASAVIAVSVDLVVIAVEVVSVEQDLVGSVDLAVLLDL